jgi:hypothetical protein
MEENSPVPDETDTPTMGDMLEWFRRKVAEAESTLKSREQMEALWRSGDDESWAAAAAMHPSTAGKPMPKAKRIEEADRQGRIAAKMRRELRMFEAVLSVLSNTRLRDSALRLIGLLRQADPNCGPGRHPEWPLQITAADDMAPELCAALEELQDASGWKRS